MSEEVSTPDGSANTSIESSEPTKEGTRPDTEHAMKSQSVLSATIPPDTDCLPHCVENDSPSTPPCPKVYSERVKDPTSEMTVILSNTVSVATDHTDDAVHPMSVERFP